MASGCSRSHHPGLCMPWKLTSPIAQNRRTRRSTTRARRLTATGTFLRQHVLTFDIFKALTIHAPSSRRRLLISVRCRQYQEAQNPPLPLAQRNRPQVPKKPQTCAARHNEGFGTSKKRVDDIRNSDGADMNYRRRSRRERETRHKWGRNGSDTATA